MTPPASASTGSQTLSRGIRILEALAEAREPLSIDTLAARLELHRSIVYRLLRTLEEHGLVGRNPAGQITLAARMAALAAGVSRDLQSEALPELTAVASELGMTCFLGVLDREQCVTLVSVEPRHAIASVAQRPGASHPVTVGAPGKAILSLLPEDEWPAEVSERLRIEIREARERGYATSHDEVLPTVQAVSVPLRLRGRTPAAIAVLYVSTETEAALIAARLQRSAQLIVTALDG